MSLYTALGIAIGILIAVWTYLSLGTDVGLIVWAGIVAWGAFYAAGGGTEGFMKTVATNLSGILWGFLVLLIAGMIGGGVAIVALLVGVAAFMMCVQANLPLLSFIPGAFLGAATYVGAGGTGKFDRLLVMVALSMVLGALFGYVSEVLGKKLAGRPASATT
ncbi:MAG: DUF1097 domain-containing protein [Gemmatimonadetes bacterium]|nr:DUF1097 domain-containing protein [Gemmatimonadota bacterium]